MTGKERARRYQAVGAVVRFDLFLDGPEENRVTVKEVLPSFEAAEVEARRLNDVQRGKNVKYVAMGTRFLPDRADQEPKR